MPELYWNTVNDKLREILELIMACPLFDRFRLVGGTSLSLQLGHRISVDLDLFTEAPYGSIDFEAIDQFLREHFRYVSTIGSAIGGGTSYLIGETEEESVKLDLYYTNEFIQPALELDGIRLATVEEIIAMKLDVISRRGRKKDFWDVHELIDRYSVDEMVVFHQTRYPWSDDRDQILANMVNFSFADEDFDPNCLRGKHWEVIKLDIVKWTE